MSRDAKTLNEHAKCAAAVDPFDPFLGQSSELYAAWEAEYAARIAAESEDAAARTPSAYLITLHNENQKESA